jgi:hypothetical protein
MREQIYLETGEQAEVEGNIIICVEDDFESDDYGCQICCFYKNPGCKNENISCMVEDRKDEKPVHFEFR